MLPVKACDSLNCLQSLVGIRSECENDDCFDYYVEDIEGVDMQKLAEIATAHSPSGVEVARDLIRTASTEMLGDIELLLGAGYSMQDTFGALCSSCDFVTLYTNGGGVLVQNVIASKYSILRISRIDVLTNFTGTGTLRIDDNKTVIDYDVELVAGEISPVILDYSTQETSAKIYFVDQTIPTALVRCARSSSCGCGGNRNNNALDTVRYSGLLLGATSTNQYGFKVCASISCSSDLLTCDLMQQTPRIFGLTLLYKVGQKFYSQTQLSNRLNQWTNKENSEDKIDMKAYYEGLYKKRLNGTAGNKGVATVVNQYLRNRTDRCVSCEGASKIGWAVG